MRQVDPAYATLTTNKIKINKIIIIIYLNGRADLGTMGLAIPYQPPQRPPLIPLKEAFRLYDLIVRTTPYTLHPTPYTLHPAPCTLHPTPCTLHPTPTPHIPHPTTHTPRVPKSPQALKPRILKSEPSNRPPLPQSHGDSVLEHDEFIGR